MLKIVMFVKKWEVVVASEESRQFTLSAEQLLQGMFEFDTLYSETYPSIASRALTVLHGNLCPENVIVHVTSTGAVEWYLHNFSKSIVTISTEYVYDTFLVTCY